MSLTGNLTVKIQGNFFVLYETASPNSEVFRTNRTNCNFKYTQEGGVDYFEFKALTQASEILSRKENFTNLIDDRTGSAFTSVGELIEFLSLNLGSNLIDVYSGIFNNFIFINKLSDLPTAVSNVITLEANTTYYFTTTIDLQGARLVGSDNTVLLGSSSENSRITSTGLGTGVALFTTEYTTPIRHLVFQDVDTGIDIDGNTRTVALDWTGVNFLNVPNVGTINTCDNFIFTKGAFLNSAGLALTGTIGTVAFNNSLFNSDSANTIFDLQAGLTITRRFRIIYSSIIALSGETAISLNASATIPTQGIILDTCNFAGGGTYLSGITFQDNEALFVNNVGITNSREVSQYYMNGNATATTVSAIGATYKVSGTTTSGTFTSKFTNTDNRATYTGNVAKIFKTVATLSVESGNNNVIGVYIAKNGTLLTDSEVYITTNAGGRAEACTVQTLTTLDTNDYIEIFVENDTAVTDITVTDLNVIID